MNIPEQSKKKMKRWKKVLLIVVISLLTLAIAAGIAVYAAISHYYNLMNYEPINTDEPIIDVPDETDFPDYPDFPTLPGTSPGGTSVTPGTHGNTGAVTGPGITNAGETVPLDPMTSAALASFESSIGNNAQDDYRMEFSKNVTNILLIGTDGRTVTERGRSDSMILLSINKDTKQIIMTSIMRDIYLYIPGLTNSNRINVAYASGGVSLLLKTIEENFKIHVDQYIRINFFGFEKIVDRLGGLDIELSQAEIDYVGIQDTATPGMVHLNGAEVLKYCRCRYVPKNGVGADFARTVRQREVMTLISQKLKGSSFSTLNDLLEEFLPQVVTNLKKSDFIDYMFDFNTYMNDYEIKSYRLPIDGSWKYARIRNMSVLSVNFDMNIKALESYIKGTA